MPDEPDDPLVPDVPELPLVPLLPAPLAETVITSPLVVTAKYAVAVPGNAPELLYAGKNICFVCRLNCATIASDTVLLPLNILK